MTLSTKSKSRYVDNSSLPRLLDFWGVRPIAKSRWQRGGQVVYVRSGVGLRRSANVRRQPAHRLHQWLGDARKAYLDRVRRCHPDRGGCNRRTAQVNAAWTRTKKLFARIGIHENLA